MRRPFKKDPEVYRQVVNKQIQLFNEQYSTQIQDEMYFLPETADIQTVTRAIEDFDYLVHSFNPQSDALLSDYLAVRGNMVGYRIALYADMFHNSVYDGD